MKHGRSLEAPTIYLVLIILLTALLGVMVHCSGGGGMLT